MSKTVLKVEGMSCPSCISHVSEALAAVPGVDAVDVRFEQGTVEIDHDATTPAGRLIAVLGEAGYEAHPRDPRSNV